MRSVGRLGTNSCVYAAPFHARAQGIVDLLPATSTDDQDISARAHRKGDAVQISSEPNEQAFPHHKFFFAPAYTGIWSPSSCVLRLLQFVFEEQGQRGAVDLLCSLVSIFFHRIIFVFGSVRYGVRVIGCASTFSCSSIACLSQTWGVTTVVQGAQCHGGPRSALSPFFRGGAVGQ